MTEREKADNGLLYDANDAELIKARAACKDLCFDYNNCRPSDTEKQSLIFDKIVAKHGKNCFVTAPFNCDYGYNIIMGDNFYANHNCIILDCAQITFGNNVFVAPNCCFTAAAHPIDPAERAKGLEFAKPINIGDNVWIGAGVTVLPGVNIGENCVIGAGSIVNKDIPANSIAVGNPCRVIRSIEKK